MTTDQETARGGSDLQTPLAFAGVVVLGGLNIVAVKFSNQDFDAFFGAGLRFALAAAVFLAIALVMRIPFPKAVPCSALCSTASTGLWSPSALPTGRSRSCRRASPA